jgi:hypothetical protein
MTVEEAVARQGKGRFAPGHRKLGGRRPGSKNVIPSDVRALLLAAGAKRGGPGGLQALFERLSDEILAAHIVKATVVPAKAPEDKSTTGGSVKNVSISNVNILGLPQGTFLTAEGVARLAARRPVTLEHAPVEHEATTIEHEASVVDEATTIDMTTEATEATDTTDDPALAPALALTPADWRALNPHKSPYTAFPRRRVLRTPARARARPRAKPRGF